MLCLQLSHEVDRIHARFTQREIDYLEQKCGLHLNHLVKFIESILSDENTHDILVNEHRLKRVFLNEQV